MNSSTQTIIDNLKKNNIIQEGEFTLKSGQKSNIYIDLRKVISFPHIHEQVCKELVKKINHDLDIDLICGTPYGAVPYASYISISERIPMIFMRKEEKSHGTKRLIEGNYEENMNVLLIEDVTTTGGSVAEAASKLEDHGLNVVQIITIVSRCPLMNMVVNNIPVNYLIHINDIIPNYTRQDINQIVQKKKSRICLAADVDTMNELVKLIHKVGNDICVLKLHSDIITDFFINFKANCKKLKTLKQIYDFKIWEDRKLADIGSVMQKQINIIKEWADIVSIHPIAGYDSVKNIQGIDIIFIVELSTKGTLTNHNYRLDVLHIAERVKNVIGIVCQHKFSDKLMHFVPGISLVDKNDNMGQQYNDPKDRDFADIFVVGRGIYKADDPKEAVNKYKKLTFHE